jgi:hypothetical protein
MFMPLKINGFYKIYNSELLKFSLTNGAEPFLRSRQLCSYLRTYQHFMEPEGLLPYSQKPSIGSYLEPYQSNPYHPILSKIHFNIVHPPMSSSSQWSLAFWLSHQYPLCISLLPIRATCPVHLKMLRNFITNIRYTRRQN